LGKINAANPQIFIYLIISCFASLLSGKLASATDSNSWILGLSTPTFNIPLNKYKRFINYTKTFIFGVMIGLLPIFLN